MRWILYGIFCFAPMPVYDCSLHAQSSLREVLKTHTLANGSRLTCLSTPHAVSSAIGLEVQVGSWQDPQRYPGMAHLVGQHLLGAAEHMLAAPFASSFKSDAKVAAHTGKTCYTCSVAHHELASTLKALFLACTRSWTREDIHAACAAFKEASACTLATMATDQARVHRMLQLHAQAQHPFAQCNQGPIQGHMCYMGNVDALAQLTPELFSQWKAYYYQPKAMQWILVSALPHSELEAIIKEIWGGSGGELRGDLAGGEPEGACCQEKKALPEVLCPIPAQSDSFAQDKWQGQISCVESPSSRYSITLAWEISPDPSHSLLPCASHVAALLSEKGEGSLYAEYVQKGWALSVSSDVCLFPNGALLLTCEWGVTDKGFRHETEIVQGVMESLKRWKTTGIPLYYMEERQKQRTLQLALQTCPKIPQNILANVQRLLHPEEGTATYSTSIWRTLCAQMGPETMHLVKMAPQEAFKIDLDKQDPLTGISYATFPFSKRQRQRWMNAPPAEKERIPPPNPWMPQSVPKGMLIAVDSIRGLDLDHVEHVTQSRVGTLYYQTIPENPNVPESSLSGAWRVRWGLATDNDSPVDRLYRALFLDILSIASKSRCEVAERAGISTQIWEEERALWIEVFGYPERLLDYLNTWLNIGMEELVGSRVSPEAFLQAKQHLLAVLQERSRRWNGSNGGNGVIQYLLNQAFQRELPYAEQILLLKNLTVEEFQSQAMRLMRPCSVDVIGVSPLQVRQAVEWWGALQKRVEPILVEANEATDLRATDLRAPTTSPLPLCALQLCIPQEGHRCIWVIEVPLAESEHVPIELLTLQLKKFLCTALCIEEQLAHTVDLDALEYQGGQGGHFIVCSLESHRAEPQELLARLERCIERFIERVCSGVNMADVVNVLDVQGVIKELQTMPKTARAACQFISEAMLRKNKDLKWKQRKAEQYASLSALQYQTHVKALLGKQNRKRMAFLLKGRPVNQEQEFMYCVVRSWKGLWKMWEKSS